MEQHKEDANNVQDQDGTAGWVIVLLFCDYCNRDATNENMFKTRTVLPGGSFFSVFVIAIGTRNKNGRGYAGFQNQTG